MREEYAAEGPDVILSRALRQAHEPSGSSGASRVVVLLNRRGYAAAVFCRQCGHTMECPNCSVSLTVHTGEADTGRARCHYCNYSRVVPKQCVNCAAPYLEHVGFGTERVEAEIVDAVSRRARRPRRSRHDSAARQSRRHCCIASRQRELDVLVGTQMIAKGHDFPMSRWSA